MSSSASIALTIIGATTSKPVPSWIYWSAAAVCFLVASYQVWKRQLQATESAKAETESARAETESTRAEVERERERTVVAENEVTEANNRIARLKAREGTLALRMMIEDCGWFLGFYRELDQRYRDEARLYASEQPHT